MLLREGGLTFRVQNLRRNGQWVPRGSIGWRNSSGGAARVSYRVAEYLAEAEVFLTYTADGQVVEEKIGCERTIQFHGGYRWWFLCPGCGLRMGALHLPPAKTLFRCRHCYKLRYQSQERDIDFLLKPIMANAGVPRRIARKYLYEASAIINAGK